MQDENIKTEDKSISAEIESNMSEIDTADTQLNTSCSTKESKTHHCSNFHAIAESFDRLCFSSFTSFEDCERPSVHANVHIGRMSAMNDCVSATVTSSLAIEQHQSSDGPAEVEEQEWEITEILEKRVAGSETVYRVRWKDISVCK